MYINDFKVHTRKWKHITTMAVALAENYTLVLTDNHDVIATAKVLNANLQSPLPVLMDKDEIFDGEHVTMVAAKFDTCACVTQEGSVWVWGATLCRVVAKEWPPVRISTTSAALVSPSVTLTSHPAVMVTCFLDGIMFLTADGCIRERGLRDIFSRSPNITIPITYSYGPSWFGSVRIDMIASGKAHMMALGKFIPPTSRVTTFAERCSHTSALVVLL